MLAITNAEVLIPAIVILATAICGWILAWLDVREAEKLADEMVELASEAIADYLQVLDKLEAYEGEANLQSTSQQTGQVANKNESENLADRYSSGYLHGNPALSRNVSNTHDGKQVGPRGQGVRRVPEVAAGAGPTPRTEWPRSKHDV